MARHNQVGKDGEDVAEEYVRGLGLTIVARNFSRPYGEIDIVARETGGKLVFVEVKTVSYETEIRPEENLHYYKLKRLKNIIQVYLETKRHTGEWRFDVVSVFLNHTTGEAKIRHLEDVIIGS